MFNSELKEELRRTKQNYEDLLEGYVALVNERNAKEARLASELREANEQLVEAVRAVQSGDTPVWIRHPAVQRALADLPRSGGQEESSG